MEQEFAEFIKLREAAGRQGFAGVYPSTGGIS